MIPDEYKEDIIYYEAVSRTMRYYDQSLFDIKLFESDKGSSQLTLMVDDQTKYHVENIILYEQTD